MASTDAAQANRIPVGGDDIDTSETVSGGRKRASVEGVMDPDTPTQLFGEKCRAGDLHLAFVADQDGVKENAQWRQFETNKCAYAQSREDPGPSFIMDGWGA